MMNSSRKRKPLTSYNNKNEKRVPKISLTPGASFWLILVCLYYLQRKRLMMAVAGSWILIKSLHSLLISDQFQAKVLLLQFTRKWPPCDLDRPTVAQKLPLFWRWIDWIPSRVGLDDLKSFPGIRDTSVLELPRKRKIGAWLVAPTEPTTKKQRGVVLYFRGRTGHRGSRSRVRMYERIRREPIGLHCVAFDGDDEELTSERGLLVSAHAVWSTLTRPPYDFGTDSVVIWGSSLGCCSAANLCLYLMRRGTPPAALVLENPASSFPKLLASRFGFMGENVRARVEKFAKENLIHRFDLEKRIRSICSFGMNVPILLISAEKDWTIPSSHAHRLADIAAAFVASKRVLHLSQFVTRDELFSDRNFLATSAAFIHKALSDAKQSIHQRTLSVDFGTSPSTWASDQAAEDRLFADEDADAPFGL